MTTSYYDDCERPEFYNEERVTARKEHVCCECRRLIPIGAKYVRCTGKSDGSLFSEKQHVECRDFAAKVNLGFIGACAIPFGDVGGAMRNLESDYGIAPPDAIALRDEWSRIKVLYPIREGNRGEIPTE